MYLLDSYQTDVSFRQLSDWCIFTIPVKEQRSTPVSFIITHEYASSESSASPRISDAVLSSLDYTLGIWWSGSAILNQTVPLHTSQSHYNEPGQLQTSQSSYRPASQTTHPSFPLHTSQSHYTPASQTTDQPFPLHTSLSNYRPASPTTHQPVQLQN